MDKRVSTWNELVKRRNLAYRNENFSIQTLKVPGLISYAYLISWAGTRTVATRINVSHNVLCSLV